MRRIVKFLGLAVVLSAILVIALAGTAFAAGNNSGTGTQTQNQGEVCLSGECPCGDCVSGTCEPVGGAYKYSNRGSGEYGKYKNNVVP